MKEIKGQPLRNKSPSGDFLYGDKTEKEKKNEEKKYKKKKLNEEKKR